MIALPWPALKVIVGATALVVLIASFALLDATTAVVSSLLGCAMLAIAYEDSKRFIVPDFISLPAVPAGLLATKFLSAPEIADQLLMDHLAATILCAATLGAVRYFYRLARNAEGIGLGDVKLAAVTGAWTGLQGIGPVLLLACVSAILYLGYLALVSPRQITGKTAIPFGCFLAPSIWLVWLFYQL